jgi:hypothetical protein
MSGVRVFKLEEAGNAINVIVTIGRSGVVSIPQVIPAAFRVTIYIRLRDVYVTALCKMRVTRIRKLAVVRSDDVGLPLSDVTVPALFQLGLKRSA